MGEMKWQKHERMGEHYFHLTHASGLRIYVMPKKLSTVYALFATKYGSIDNIFVPGESGEEVTVPDGIAHFLEHKMFENEDGEDTFAKYARFGGNANAYTSFDKTAYLFSATEQVYDNLRVLLTFVTHPYFTPQNVQKEQGIIGEELRMYLDEPGQKIFYNLLEAMYQNHPCRRNIGGTIESIAAITPEILYQCYQTFYRLDNMVLVVCGDVTPEKVLQIADEVLPKQEKTALPVQRRYPEEPRAVVRDLVVDYADIAQPLLYVGIKDNDVPDTPAKRSKKAAAVDVLLEMLFGKSSALYNDLYENGDVLAMRSYYEMSETYAYACIYALCDDPMKVRDRICACFAQAQKQGLDKRAFLRAKRMLYAQDVTAFDSTEEMATACMDAVLDGYDIFDEIDDMAQVTMEDVEKVLNAMFVSTQTSASVLYPYAQKETPHA